MMGFVVRSVNWDRGALDAPMETLRSKGAWLLHGFRLFGSVYVSLGKVSCIMLRIGGQIQPILLK